MAPGVVNEGSAKAKCRYFVDTAGGNGCRGIFAVIVENTHALIGNTGSSEYRGCTIQFTIPRVSGTDAPDNPVTGAFVG